MAKGLEQLTIDNLGDLVPGGLLRAAFEMEMTSIREDVRKRRKLESPRELTIKIKFTPEMDNEGFIGSLLVDADVTKKLPGVKLAARACVEEVEQDGEIGLGILFLTDKKAQAATEAV